VINLLGGVNDKAAKVISSFVNDHELPFKAFFKQKI